jgi:hypothetical protein
MPEPALDHAVVGMQSFSRFSSRTAAPWPPTSARRVSAATDGTPANGSPSPARSTGRRLVAFNSGTADSVADDTNNAADLFVHDVRTHTTERVSVG